VVDHGAGGWGDASWPGVTTSSAEWNTQFDLSQIMMPNKKVSVVN